MPPLSYCGPPRASGRLARVAIAIALLGVVDGAAGAPARWVRRASMGVPRQEVGVAALGETLYAVGGFAGSRPSAAVEAYDTRADSWSGVASLPEALHHVMAAAVGNRVYAAGGLGASSPSGSSDATFAYDPDANAWLRRAPMPRPRGAGATAVIDGLVYVVGGLRGSESVRDLAAYDPAADAWTELAPMPTARDHLAAGAIDGRLYVVGGRDDGTLFAVVEVFDPATGSWSAGRARMPTARGGLGAAALDGLLYVFGGEGNPESPLGTFPQAEAYDPVRDAWTRLPNMGVPRHGIGVAAVDGVIYVMGGATRQGFGPSGAGEVFIPGTDEVLSIRRLSAPGKRRLTLRARLVAAAGIDPAAAPVRIEVDGREVAVLPVGSLVARGAGVRWRVPRTSRPPGLRRFDLRRVRSGDLAVLVTIAGDGLPSRGAAATISVALGDRAFSGGTRVRPTR